MSEEGLGVGLIVKNWFYPTDVCTKEPQWCPLQLSTAKDTKPIKFPKEGSTVPPGVYRMNIILHAQLGHQMATSKNLKEGKPWWVFYMHLSPDIIITDIRRTPCHLWVPCVSWHPGRPPVSAILGDFTFKPWSVLVSWQMHSTVENRTSSDFNKIFLRFPLVRNLCRKHHVMTCVTFMEMIFLLRGILAAIFSQKSKRSITIHYTDF